MQQNALKLASSNPYAISYLKGNSKNPKLKGSVEFFPWSTGSILKLEIVGLPTGDEENVNNFFAFHIHEKGNCELGDISNPFPKTGNHYNPSDKPHPQHVGDLPMIYSNNGYAFMLFYTSRFSPDDIIGKSAVIHSGIDDMKTQPSGDSGTKIACGEIIKRRWMFA